jgi:hypothetical protein
MLINEAAVLLAEHVAGVAHHCARRHLLPLAHPRQLQPPLKQYISYIYVAYIMHRFQPKYHRFVSFRMDQIRQKGDGTTKEDTTHVMNIP